MVDKERADDRLEEELVNCDGINRQKIPFSYEELVKMVDFDILVVSLTGEGEIFSVEKFDNFKLSVLKIKSSRVSSVLNFNFRGIIQLVSTV